YTTLLRSLALGLDQERLVPDQQKRVLPKPLPPELLLLHRGSRPRVPRLLPGSEQILQPLAPFARRIGPGKLLQVARLRRPRLLPLALRCNRGTQASGSS